MGCVVSTLIGVLWCRKGCNAAELAGEFAYFPPSPSSYIITASQQGNLVCTLNAFYFQARTAASLTRTQAEVVELRPNYAARGKGFGTTAGNSAAGHTAGGVVGEGISASGVPGGPGTIPAFFFSRPGARVTLLFSHSNAVDCGFLYRFLDEVSHRLEVNVFAYEFSGYGPTASHATPRNYTQRADVVAAYEHLLARGIDPARQVIAYGQSIGSYPTLHLAAHRRVLGVALHSPIAAGLQVITRIDGCCAPHRVYSLLEPYPNMQLIKKVRDPVYIMHGTADDTVELKHGQKLHALTPAECRYEPYWATGATHEDMIEVDDSEYFRRLQRFIDYCEARREGRPSGEGSPLRAEGLVASEMARERKWDMRPVPPAASVTRAVCSGAAQADALPMQQPHGEAAAQNGAVAGVGRPPDAHVGRCVRPEAVQVGLAAAADFAVPRDPLAASGAVSSGSAGLPSAPVASPGTTTTASVPAASPSVHSLSPVSPQSHPPNTQLGC